MGKFIELTGRKFGRLTVINKEGRKHGEISWLCECECGKRKTVPGSSLRKGVTQSCGCLHSEILTERNYKHGKSKNRSSSAYASWCAMIQRCTNPNHGQFKDWGGRGIKICERWSEDFSNFLEDMGEKPSANHSLDRIDVNGNYEPSNCRWATNYEQMRNRRMQSTNTSGVVGVYYCKSNGKWKSSIISCGKTISLGYHYLKEDAIKARKEAELKYWGKSS